MSVIAELGIDTYINAHDTYTVYGGSRMSNECIEAMREISSTFVDFADLERATGEKIASLTGNEAAYITNGAAGALSLCACVTLVGENEYYYSQLPKVLGPKKEIIMMRSQKNAYAKALELSGCDIVEIGDADETLQMELEGVISEKTAAIAFFDNINYKRASMPLSEVIRIARAHSVPVIVDAAACLPPKSNLNYYSKIGADFVIFSGGKTLMGPQDSGLIFASKKNIELCRKYGAPAHGILRSCKTSREAIVALYVAVKNFMESDESQFYENCLKKLESIKPVFGKYETRIVNHGPVGQTYPRLFIDFRTNADSLKFKEMMYREKVYIGVENNYIYISPLNLREDEINILVSRICNALNEVNQ